MGKLYRIEIVQTLNNCDDCEFFRHDEGHYEADYCTQGCESISFLGIPFDCPLEEVLEND